MGVEANVPQSWNKIVQHSHGNVTLFDFDGAPAFLQRQKFVFKLIKGCFL